MQNAESIRDQVISANVASLGDLNHRDQKGVEPCKLLDS